MSLWISLVILGCIPIFCWLILGMVKLIYYIPKRNKKTNIGFRKKLFLPISFMAMIFYIIANENFEILFKKEGFGWLESLLHPLLVSSIAYTLAILTKLFVKAVSFKFDITQENNLRQRKVRTQLQYVERMAMIIIWVIGIGLILLSFSEFKKYGESLLTSAGVASVIIGFAAQKSIANLIAGFQIAFTQPIRIDDAVIIENEWGWVEEITLTYIVIKIWDLRRLVLPIKYVIENPFQNWTRNSAQIIGTVFLYVNYKADVDALKLELKRILESTPLWDKQVQVLQIVELKEHHIELRALMSAKNSPQAWDLRCYVREKLVAYLNQREENPLPLYRVSLKPEKALDLNFCKIE